MATPLGRALPRATPRTRTDRPALVRRGTLALLVVVGTLFATVPAQAAPATSAGTCSSCSPGEGRTRRVRAPLPTCAVSTP